MIFSGEKINILLNGERIVCNEFMKGILEPANPSIAINKQVELVCNKCGSTLYVHRKHKNKPECLR
jgi:hypothetical protein